MTVPENQPTMPNDERTIAGRIGQSPMGEATIRPGSPHLAPRPAVEAGGSRFWSQSAGMLIFAHYEALVISNRGWR